MKKNLGIFYTNNNVPNVVNYCLKDLIKFNGKADIMSCVWQHIPDNPFPELIAYTKHRHHLNIVIQILQLLYTAQSGISSYEYVSFLEHDVLYPNDYFNFDNIDVDCDAFINRNYIGLCADGFQYKTQNESPLHQITMKFNYAIQHFENMLILAMKHRSVVLEPAQLCNRNCITPAIHINHGKHFTSHHTIYSRDNICTDHPDWGNGPKLMQCIMGI